MTPRESTSPGLSQLELAYRSSTGEDRSPAIPIAVLRDSVGAFVLFHMLSFAVRKFGLPVRTDDQNDDQGSIVPKPREDFATKSAIGARVYFCSTCGQDMEIDDDYRCTECRYTV